MKLSPLLAHMETAGLGTRGVDLFRDHLPSQITKGLVLLSQTNITIDKYTGLRKGAIDVVARGSTEEEAHDLAMASIDALCGYGLRIGGYHFYHILPESEPLVYPRSDNGLIEASVVFDVIFAEIGD